MMINTQFFRFVWYNYLYICIALLTFLFISGYILIKSSLYLVLLNSVLLGVLVSISITYGYFFLYTLFIKSEWSREKQFIISTGLLWLFVMIICLYSYTHRTPTGDQDIPVDWMLLLSRYIAIIAAVMQVFAPDMGESLYYGVHRKVLFVGFCVGLMVAIYTMSVAISPAFASILSF